MKTKLIKTVDGYELFTQGFLKGSTNYQLIDALNIEEGNIRYKLSLKKCQAIANGYDLDELAKQKYPNVDNEDFEYDSEQEMLRDEYKKSGFLQGAKAIIEILGDKKFSEEDIAKAYDKGQMLNIKGGLQTGKNYVKTLQQNEWDVEIEMVCVIGCENLILNGENSVCCGNKKPKLDSEGCLILKKI